MDKLFDTAVFMRYALDAVPSILVVTDEDARVLYRNRAARELLKGEKIYSNRVGEAMHCIHAGDAPEGCGHGPSCSSCVVRNSVNAAFSGAPVRRKRADIFIKSGEKELQLPTLISVTGFTFEDKLYALMVVEDISELMELRSLLPICASCKKIRKEDGTWEKVETYIKDHVPESNLSHGLCPPCARKLYPGYAD